MTIDEALNVITQCCAAHVGPLADHQQIQAALQQIRDTLEADVSSNGARSPVST
jgi:hypothetical protein